MGDRVTFRTHTPIRTLRPGYRPRTWPEIRKAFDESVGYEPVAAVSLRATLDRP
jgi:hypothetical protein